MREMARKKVRCVSFSCQFISILLKLAVMPSASEHMVRVSDCDQSISVRRQLSGVDRLSSGARRSELKDAESLRRSPKQTPSTMAKTKSPKRLPIHMLISQNTW